MVLREILNSSTWDTENQAQVRFQVSENLSDVVLYRFLLSETWNSAETSSYVDSFVVKGLIRTKPFSRLYTSL